MTENRDWKPIGFGKIVSREVVVHTIAPEGNVYERGDEYKVEMKANGKSIVRIIPKDKVELIKLEVE